MCFSELVPESLDQSSVDLHLLDRAEELRGRDSALVRRAHAVPPELLPAGTNAAATAGETATAARRREAGGRRGAGEGGEGRRSEETDPPLVYQLQNETAHLSEHRTRDTVQALKSFFNIL